MRTKDVYNEDLGNVLILCRYLYGEEGNAVEVPGMVPHTMFRFTMNEDLDFVSQFRPYLGPDSKNEWTEPHVYNISIREIVDIVENLKELPAVEHPGKFRNRWEEVKMLTATMTVLNGTV